jgi:hypothetical protein
MVETAVAGIAIITSMIFYYAAQGLHSNNKKERHTGS